MERWGNGVINFRKFFAKPQHVLYENSHFLLTQSPVGKHNEHNDQLVNFP